MDNGNAYREGAVEGIRRDPRKEGVMAEKPSGQCEACGLPRSEGEVMNASICGICNEPLDRCACVDNPLAPEPMVPLRLVRAIEAAALDVGTEDMARTGFTPAFGRLTAAIDAAIRAAREGVR